MVLPESLNSDRSNIFSNMVKVESKIGTIARDAEMVYDRLSDFRKIETFIPKDKVSDFSADENSCRFTIPNAGQMELTIVDKDPCSMIKYEGSGSVPYKFYFWVQLKQLVPGDSRIKLTMKADIPSMLSFAIKGPMEKALNELVDRIATI